MRSIVRQTTRKLFRIASCVMIGVSLTAGPVSAKLCDRPEIGCPDFGYASPSSGDLLVAPGTGFAGGPALQTSGGQTESSSGQTESGPSTSSKQESPGVKNPNLSVNPVTGLVTLTGATYEPLTGEERWKLYWKMNFLSVGAYFGPFFSALLLDQATGSPAQWGGGFAGYGRRVASRTGSAILQGTFQAPVAALLHEDVRYIASTHPGFKKRALHAIEYSFLTYNDEGQPRLNIANLGAYYGSTAVSTLWLPGHYNVTSYTFSNASEQIALTVPVNLLQEFWPEVRRYVFHRH